MVEHEEMVALQEWFNTEPGLYIRNWEQRHISRLVNNVFGYHAIQIGLPHWDLLHKNRILHKWHTQAHTTEAKKTSASVVCDVEMLPFASESIDLLVLPHVLEISADPHQILREVQRVLVPEGKVVISGFNPWSLWGMHDRIPGLETGLPIAASQYLSPWRVIDWLELLSFEINAEVAGCYSPLCTQKKWLYRWRFMDNLGSKWWPMLGAVYAVKATKRVSGMTLVGLDWSKTTRPRASASMVTGRNMKELKK